MSRPFRRVAAMISVAAPLIVTALWALSYIRVLGLSNTLTNGTMARGESGIWSTGGRVLLDTVHHVDVARLPGLHGWEASSTPYSHDSQFVDQPSVTRWDVAGFRGVQSFTTAGDGTPVEWAAMTIPYWAVTLVALLIPAVTFVPTVLRRRRTLHGLCPTCGYDLCGSPDRCPECGKPAPTAAVS